MTSTVVNRVLQTVWRGATTISSVDEAVAFLPFRRKHFMNSADEEIRANCNEKFKDATKILDNLFSEPILPSTVSRRSIDHPSINPWFRGAIDKNWSLEPSFQRNVRDGAGQAHVLDETHALHHIISNYPQLRSMTLFDALAMLQHYTFPTRLLDWTQNPLTSLLFSCIDLEGKIDETVDGELFILNPLKLNYYTCSRWGLLNSEHYEAMMRLRLAMSTDYQAFIHKKCIDPSDKFFSSQMNFDYQTYLTDRQPFNIHPWHLGKELATPIAVNPVRHNQRLMIQQGSFTLHGGKMYHSAASAGDSFRLPEPLSIEDVQDAVTLFEQEKSKKDKDHFEQEVSKQTHASTKRPYSPIFISSAIIPKDKKKSIAIDLEQRGITLGKLMPELDYVSKATKAIWMVQLPRSIKRVETPPNSMNLIPQDVINSEEIEGLILLVKGNKGEEIEEKIVENSKYQLLGKRPKGEMSSAGPTVLYEMAALGRKDMMQKLLDLCQKAIHSKKLSQKQFLDIINTPNHLGWTPLYGAILYGHADCAKILIAFGASRKIGGNDLQNSLLSHAIRLEEKSPGLILACSYDPDAKGTAKPWRSDALEPSVSNVFGRCPIHYACALGATKAVEALLPYHRTLNVYQKDPLARTPLQMACVEGHADIVTLLIEQTSKRSIDLDINYRTPYGKSALDFILSATSFRKDEFPRNDNPFFNILETLFSHHAEVINVNGFVDNNFRKILALTREVILIRDIKFHDENIDPYIQEIIELLDKDEKALIDAINGQPEITGVQEKKPGIREKASEILTLIPEKESERYQNMSFLYEDTQRLALEILILVWGNEEPSLGKMMLPKTVEEEIVFGYKLKKYSAKTAFLKKLFAACTKGSEENAVKECISKLEKLLSELIDIRDKYLKLDNNGLSLLSYLVRLDNPSIIQKINNIHPGAILHLTDDEWSLPLSEACFFGAESAVETLCLLGAKVGTLSKEKCGIESPLMWAVWGCRLGIVKKLISQLEETKVNLEDYLNMQNVQDQTVLSLAVMNCGLLAANSFNHPPLEEQAKDIVLLLLEKGASVKKSPNHKGNYPGIYHDQNSILHIAAAYDVPIEIFEILVKKSPSEEEQKELLNNSNGIGEKPIHSAADYGAKDIIEWLKSYKFHNGDMAVDLMAKTADGRAWEDYGQ
jgi:ankyrin repeat protein